MTSHQTNPAPRVVLSPLLSSDASFIVELVNAPGWLKFIGDRNVKTLEQARAYIRKIDKNPHVNYWVIRLLQTREAVGIITLIHRASLDSPDIGFALLPRFEKNGYAFEAASLFLSDFSQTPTNKRIHAITIKSNQQSILLIEKLGLTFTEDIRVEGEALSL